MHIIEATPSSQSSSKLHAVSSNRGILVPPFSEKVNDIIGPTTNGDSLSRLLLWSEGRMQYQCSASLDALDCMGVSKISVLTLPLPDAPSGGPNQFDRGSVDPWDQFWVVVELL